MTHDINKDLGTGLTVRRLCELIDEAQLDLMQIRSLSWAAGALILHNQDKTIEDLKLKDRIADLVNVTHEKSVALLARLDEATTRLTEEIRRAGL